MLLSGLFASSHNWVSKGWHKAFRVSCFFASCPKAHTWNGDERLQRSHLDEMLVSASTCVLALQDYNTAAAHHCSGLEWEGPGGTYTYPGLGGRLRGLIHHQCISYSSDPAAQLYI